MVLQTDSVDATYTAKDCLEQCENLENCTSFSLGSKGCKQYKKGSTHLSGVVTCDYHLIKYTCMSDLQTKYYY